MSARVPLEKGQAIRLRLNRPQLSSLTADEKTGQNWVVTFADTMQTPSQALTAIRNITDPARANVTVPIARPGLMHRLVDPDAGDMLMAITAVPPVAVSCGGRISSSSRCLNRSTAW